MKRAYTAAPDADRCHMTVWLRDKSGARCMRRATVGLFCQQHNDLARARGFRQGEHGFELEPREAAK